MNTETPETDRETFDDPTPGYEVASADFARKLERERDQARAEAERWRDNWKNGRTMSMIVSTDLPWENAEG